VKIELVPEPAPDDPAFLAATAAIEQAGLAADVRPAGNTSAWWRAGVHEAVELGLYRASVGAEARSRSDARRWAWRESDPHRRTPRPPRPVDPGASAPA